MKKLLVFLCLAWIAKLAIAQEMNYPNLQILPAFPQAGKTLEITYQPVKELKEAKEISCIIYFGKDYELIAHEIDLNKANNVWKGSFQVPDTVQSMIFVFTNGEQKDFNGKEWYTSLVYDAQQKPIENANGSLAVIYARWYYIISENNDENYNPKIVALFEKEFAFYPTQKQKIQTLATYLRALKSEKKEQANEIIAQELANLETKKEFDENTLEFLAGQYERLGNKEKTEKYKNLLKEKYPLGNEVQWKEYDKIDQEEDFEQVKKLIEEFKTKFPSSRYIESLDYLLVNKAIKANKIDEFEKLIEGKSIDNLAHTYNNIAWGWAEKGENLDKALAYSQKATAWAKARKDMPVDMSKKPSYFTEKVFKDENKNTYGMFADTYGYILYKQGKYEEAYQYLKDAVDIYKRRLADYNERYVLALAKSKASASLKTELEDFVKTGAASGKMKEMLKEIYVKEKGSEKGWTAYIGALEKASKEKMKNEISKKLIREKAPQFTLKNLKDEEVSLASMKGKIVVVDFWATWCGPCISSFPAMQQAVDKYKDDKNVAFVFIDTWESAKDKKQNAGDFIEKKKYTFNVLLDNDNTVVANFGVSGIPTKYIIDKNGDIRFKSVGFSGNTEATVQEISLVIEMLNEETK